MHARNSSTQGFTIVELLIVVVVIATLAAISIVAFTGIQNRGYDSAVQSDFSAIAKKLEIAKVELTHYPMTISEFPDGFKFSKGAYDETVVNVMYCLNTSSPDSYALQAKSKSGAVFQLHNGTLSSVTSLSSITTCGLVGTTWSSSDPTFFGRAGHGSTGWTDTNSWKWL